MTSGQCLKCWSRNWNRLSLRTSEPYYFQEKIRKSLCFVAGKTGSEVIHSRRNWSLPYLPNVLISIHLSSSSWNRKVAINICIEVSLFTCTIRSPYSGASIVLKWSQSVFSQEVMCSLKIVLKLKVWARGALQYVMTLLLLCSIVLWHVL